MKSRTPLEIGLYRLPAQFRLSATLFIVISYRAACSFLLHWFTFSSDVSNVWHLLCVLPLCQYSYPFTYPSIRLSVCLSTCLPIHLLMHPPSVFLFLSHTLTHPSIYHSFCLRASSNLLFPSLQHSCSPNLFVQNVFVDTHDLRFPWVAFFSK